MFIKIHKSYRIIVALCDNDLIGKYFEEDKKQLDLKESFYKGDEVSYEKAVEIMKFQASEDATFSIIGPEAVKAAKDAGIIDNESIGTVDNIPCALVLL